MTTSSDPIVHAAAARSAQALMAKLIPELDRVSEVLSRAGDSDHRQQVDDLRSTFSALVKQ
jgi:hypothetical protein